MKNFLSLCTGFVTGIVVSYYILSDATLFFFLILSLVLYLDGRFFEQDMVRMHAMLLAVLCLGIFLGQFRALAFNHAVSHDLEQFETHTVNLQGEIVSVPVANGQTVKFTLMVSHEGEGTTSVPVSGRVLVTTDLFPVYYYGDVLSVHGQLKKPEQVVEPDGRVFDYPAYILKDNITETISFGSITYTGRNIGNPILKFLYSIEDHFVKSMQAVLPEPEAGLLAGIVLGAQTLSQTMSNTFRSAGLSHIVVLSGYNITIVAESVMSVALVFAPMYAFFISIIAVVLFVLMSGSGASAVRAGIMSMVALLGRRYGKSYSAGRALFFACMVMIIWNPMTLLFDPSFHLSVLATIAIVYMSPITQSFVDKLLAKIQSERWNFLKNKTTVEIFSTTLSAQIFVLPYILYISGNIQLLSLPANMLILPLVPITMLLGFLTGLFGLISRFLGLIFGIPSYIILYYDIFVAQTISSLPFAQISIPNFSLPLMLLIYSGLFYFLYTKNRPTPQVVTSDGYVVIE